MADEKKKKPDAVLSDGREIYVDTTKITRGEWKEYVKSTNADDDDELLARLSGLTVNEVTTLHMLDWVKLRDGVFERIRNPLATTG